MAFHLVFHVADWKVGNTAPPDQPDIPCRLFSSRAADSKCTQTVWLSAAAFG
jgi:hypothetical protein